VRDDPVFIAIIGPDNGFGANDYLAKSVEPGLRVFGGELFFEIRPARLFRGRAAMPLASAGRFGMALQHDGVEIPGEARPECIAEGPYSQNRDPDKNFSGDFHVRVPRGPISWTRTELGLISGARSCKPGNWLAPR